MLAIEMVFNGESIQMYFTDQNAAAAHTFFQLCFGEAVYG